MTSKQLNSDDVLKKLAQNWQAIQNFGVRSLALFGSVAVDRATVDSDLDLLVEFEGATTFDRYKVVYFQGNLALAKTEPLCNFLVLHFDVRKVS